MEEISQTAGTEWHYDAAVHREDDGACVAVDGTGTRVRKLVLEAGAGPETAGGRCPRCAETVHFAYRVVRPADGHVLETQPAASWGVSEPSLAPDLERALRTMGCGERAVFWAPLSSVWGAAAGAEAVAVEVCVRDVEHDTDCARAQRQETLPRDELAAAVVHAHERGNALFRAGHFTAALRRYTTAAELARVLATRDRNSESENESASESKSKVAVLLTNAATCAARLGDWAGAEQYARDALAADAHSAKAHHRLCTALVEGGRLREAAEAVHTATTQCPESRELRALAARIHEQCRAADRASAMYGVFRSTETAQQ